MFMPSRSQRKSFVGNTAVAKKSKVKTVSFDSVVKTQDEVRNRVGIKWMIISFHENSDQLEVIATGETQLSRQQNWPAQLFSPNSLCYGLYRIDTEPPKLDDEGSQEDSTRTDNQGFSLVSFCWKGTSLSVSLRRRFTEYNNIIQEHLGGMAHFMLKFPDDLKEESMLKLLPHSGTRRRRTYSRQLSCVKLNFSDKLKTVYSDIRSDDNPFNWLVCGYAGGSNDGQGLTGHDLILIDHGMTGLFALKGIGGIRTALQREGIMYVYLRVNIPMHHGSEQCVPKYVLVTWQGDSQSTYPDSSLKVEPSSNSAPPPLPIEIKNSLLSPDKKSDSHFSDISSEHSCSEINNENSVEQPPLSSLLDTAQAHQDSSEIYRFFQHHIHFFASNMSELSEDAVRERIRRAIDSDSMLIRVVWVESTNGTSQPAQCVEIPRSASVKSLRQAISLTVGLPPESQRIVWLHRTDESSDVQTSTNQWSQTSTKATLLEQDSLRLCEDIGLAHGDKVHVEDNGSTTSVLAQLIQRINSGTSVVSLSAERRHEVQRSVEAREAELRSCLSKTHLLIKQRAVALKKTRPSSFSATALEERIEPSSTTFSETPLTPPPSSPESLLLKKNDHQEEKDMVMLQQQAELLASQNEYLEIPYESIRILEGKSNELGMGKAATVYRGLWMSANGTAAEVAIKLFRYVRLTDSIMNNYRSEVAMLRKLKHPNIVLFIGACTNPKLMILTEYCARKSLHDVLQNKAIFSTMPWKFKLRMMIDAARGIQYLHSKRIIHRDIKSHNFLVDDDWRVKVADFGISKILDHDSQAFTQCGTTGWVAPEVLVDEDVGYTFKADNWSFAIVMWEMIAGDNVNPFIGMAPVKFYMQTINKNIRPAFDDHVDKDYADLIRDCWDSEPQNRPSFSNIVTRLEKIAEQLDIDYSLPPSFAGGYHSLNN